MEGKLEAVLQIGQRTSSTAGQFFKENVMIQSLSVDIENLADEDR